MATFPTVAKLLHQPFTVKRDPGVVRSEMESGLTKQAVVRSRVMVERQVAYAFGSLADFDTFIDWFYDDIGRVGWFDWRDPVDDAIKEARIKGGDLGEERPNKQMDVWVLEFTIETWG